jgi:hypothetical protein
VSAPSETSIRKRSNCNIVARIRPPIATGSRERRSCQGERGGGRTLRAINYALVRAAPVAAAKVRPSSIQAGPAIILASIRFQLALSSSKHLPHAAF